jgi:hypothetical protein
MKLLVSIFCMTGCSNLFLVHVASHNNARCSDSESIKCFSEGLGLRLDGELAVHQNISRTSAINTECKATPAKVEAWRMWQEKGLSFSEIAVRLFKRIFY